MDYDVGIVKQRRILSPSNSYFSVSAVAGYTGPGDVVGSATAFWGLRAYNNTYALPGNNPAIDIVDSGNSNPATINILSTGDLDEQTLNAWINAPGSHGTAFIKKMYDQTGNAIHATQSTVANMATIQQNAIGTHSGMLGAGSAWYLASEAASQPFSFSLVAKNTVDTVTTLFGHDGANGINYEFSGTNIVVLDFGSGGAFAVSLTKQFHAIQAVVNGTSPNSHLYIDGTDNTGDAGTSGIGSFIVLFAQDGTPTRGFNGTLLELGQWPKAFNATEAASLNTNQHNYWGTFP